MMLHITKVVRETRNVKTFFFSKNFDATPGQFAMVWLPGVDEKPMSFSYRNGITVKEIGNFTKELSKLKSGDKIGIRGPYGRGFKIMGKKVLLVGGGIGVAPLRFLKEKMKAEISAFLGFKTKSDILFLRDFRKVRKLVVTTEDASYGLGGLVTDYLEDTGSVDCAYVCGPELMMAKVREILNLKTQFLLERYMKCGIGLCGSCEIDGKLVCLDGPAFFDHKLREDFGRFKRNECGRKIRL